MQVHNTSPLWKDACSTLVYLLTEKKAWIEASYMTVEALRVYISGMVGVGGTSG